jgi:hypothetical protein
LHNIEHNKKEECLEVAAEVGANAPAQPHLLTHWQRYEIGLGGANENKVQTICI